MCVNIYVFGIIVCLFGIYVDINDIDGGGMYGPEVDGLISIVTSMTSGLAGTFISADIAVCVNV